MDKRKGSGLAVSTNQKNKALTVNRLGLFLCVLASKLAGSLSPFFSIFFKISCSQSTKGENALI